MPKCLCYSTIWDFALVQRYVVKLWSRSLSIVPTSVEADADFQVQRLTLLFRDAYSKVCLLPSPDLVVQMYCNVPQLAATCHSSGCKNVVSMNTITPQARQLRHAIRSFAFSRSSSSSSSGTCCSGSCVRSHSYLPLDGTLQQQRKGVRLQATPGKAVFVVKGSSLTTHVSSVSFGLCYACSR
jgi:hypothetical protein